jgi:proteasome assembly chaperone (PAC2) family protein
MALKFYQEPALESPDLICGWPGIGRIGIMAVDYLRRALAAEELAEIEPWDFFEPNKVTVCDGLLKELQFPTSKFYYKKLPNRDLIIFIGEEQPAAATSHYAGGEKAYRMANLVLDAAAKFGCRRVFTSGAGVTQTHHTLKPRVWAVPNSEELVGEVKKYPNTIVMQDIEGTQGNGGISGLNGLMLGVARKRGLKGFCLMGEIPYYLQGSPTPYPKASVSVLEVLSAMLEIDVDLIPLNEMARKMEESIDTFLTGLLENETIPPEVRKELKDNVDRLKSVSQRPGPITKEDQKRIMENIEDLFKKGEKNEGN